MNDITYSNETNGVALVGETALNYEDCIVFEDIPEYDTQDYDIFDDKDFKKYIQDIEKICRKSFEYRQFVNYLREYMNMNKCSFFSNVTNSDTFKIKIHLHHCPFSLYDIVMTIFNKRSFYGESLEVEMVAKEVMYIHYFLMVGIIPLAETVHELVHAQVIFIPIDHVMGNYSEFITTYKEFIPEDAMDRFNAMSQRTLSYNAAQDMEILSLNPVAIRLPGNDGLGTYTCNDFNDVLMAMNKRVQEIKDNHYQLPSYVEAEQQIIPESKSYFAEEHVSNRAFSYFEVDQKRAFSYI